MAGLAGGPDAQGGSQRPDASGGVGAGHMSGDAGDDGDATPLDCGDGAYALFDTTTPLVRIGPIRTDRHFVYWAQFRDCVDPPFCSAYRADIWRAPNCGPAELLIQSDHGVMPVLEVDETHVYWVTTTPMPGTRQVLKRTPKTGVGPTEQLAEATLLQDLALFRNNLYWVEHEVGTVSQVSVEGSSMVHPIWAGWALEVRAGVLGIYARSQENEVVRIDAPPTAYSIPNAAVNGFQITDSHVIWLDATSISWLNPTTGAITTFDTEVEDSVNRLLMSHLQTLPTGEALWAGRRFIGPAEEDGEIWVSYAPDVEPQLVLSRTRIGSLGAAEDHLFFTNFDSTKLFGVRWR